MIEIRADAWYTNGSVGTTPDMHCSHYLAQHWHHWMETEIKWTTAASEMNLEQFDWWTLGQAGSCCPHLGIFPGPQDFAVDTDDWMHMNSSHYSTWVEWFVTTDAGFLLHMPIFLCSGTSLQCRPITNKRTTSMLTKLLSECSGHMEEEGGIEIVRAGNEEWSVGGGHWEDLTAGWLQAASGHVEAPYAFPCLWNVVLCTFPPVKAISESTALRGQYVVVTIWIVYVTETS